MGACPDGGVHCWEFDSSEFGDVCVLVFVRLLLIVAHAKTLDVKARLH